jgi:hypothetical protein
MMVSSVFVASLGVAAGAHGSVQEAKAPAIEASAIPGMWAFVVDTPHGKMTLSLEMRLEKDQIAGSLASEQMGTHAIAGEYVDGTLKFTAQPESGPLTFTGKFKDRDTIAGYLSGHAGDMIGVATRVKKETQN